MEGKYRNRHLEARLPVRGQRTLVLITGARQTGKTTMAKEHYPELSYLNFDAPEIRKKVGEISTFSWPRDVGVAVLDEVQKEPIALEKIKYCFDEGTIDFSVLLGSSQLLLLKKVRESLAGRVALYELFPFMVSELNGLRPPLLQSLLSTKNIDEVLENLPSVFLKEGDSPQEHILRWGGMPTVLRLSGEEERKKWLKDYQYTYLERDLLDLAKVHDLGPFQKFQSLAAHRHARLLNYSELARDASISVDTARRYFEYLRISYQCFFLQPYFSNQSSALIKTPKVYWIDMGVLRQATQQWEVQSGEIYENFVVAEIYKWVRTMGLDIPMHFYRTRGGLECDLLLKTPHGTLGFEIKYRGKIYPKDLRSLQEVAREFEGNWLGSIVIYTGDKIEQLPGKNCWAIPSWRLLG